jgi:EAL domain-containing protein (putative c-di-GMP-specific phosphodiesterase class I)/GGDEF domain-containing protein
VSPLSTFLTALCDALGARSACFVPMSAGDASPALSHPDRAMDPGQLSTLTDEAREWRTSTNGETVRRNVVGLGVIDIAAVRDISGESLGALMVTRAPNDRTDRSTAAAEVELAADLIPSVLDSFPPAGARESLVEWAAAQRGPKVAFSVSVDGLGVANEVLGYRAGDTVLRAIIDRIESWTGPTGRVARAGGARYLVVRTDLSEQAAARREAERLRESIAAPVEVDGIAISRSASIGVSMDTGGAASAEQLLWSAVRAGAAVRTAGGDDVGIYSESSTSERISRLQLDLELYGALAAGQLRVHYQPEFELANGTIVAVEALVRWQHHERGLLGADAFVPEAEQTRTFAAVQRWIVDEACRQLAEWRSAGIADGVVVRINMSPAQVVQGEATTVLLEALERFDLPGSALCVELTERRMPEDVDVLAREIRAWHARGITVAIDDFGTGEATLLHLLDLPVDILKIDQRFVAAMTSDLRAASIVTAVLGLAQALGLGAVAEGVDGPETAEALVRLGCRRGQGNGLVEAMAPDALQALLHEQTDRR